MKGQTQLPRSNVIILNAANTVVWVRACAAVGHGCPTLDDDQHRRVLYFVEGDSFYANLSCTEGHVFDDEATAVTKILECLDFFWDARVPHCISK